jgi:predicted Zn-dependent protease
MSALEPPDTHLLSAAEGWLMLDAPHEARHELRGIRPENRRHPEVLQVRWLIYAAAHKWRACLSAAQALVIAAPENPFGWVHRSFALHEMHRTQEAFELLLPAARQFNKDFIIPYNLACYACQLGRLDEAWAWYQRAHGLAGAGMLEAMSLEDNDLQPIWGRIRLPAKPPSNPT